MAEHDQGGFGVTAWRLGVRGVGDAEFAVLVFLQSSRVVLLWRSPCRLDGDEIRPRDNLAVDVGSHLGLEAWRVKALCGIRVTGKCFPLARRRRAHRVRMLPLFLLERPSARRVWKQ
jgi:hypothetical protein